MSTLPLWLKMCTCPEVASSDTWGNRNSRLTSGGGVRGGGLAAPGMLPRPPPCWEGRRRKGGKMMLLLQNGGSSAPPGPVICPRPSLYPHHHHHHQAPQGPSLQNAERQETNAPEQTDRGPAASRRHQIQQHFRWQTSALRSKKLLLPQHKLLETADR